MPRLNIRRSNSAGTSDDVDGGSEVSVSALFPSSERRSSLSTETWEGAARRQSSGSLSSSFSSVGENLLNLLDDSKRDELIDADLDPEDTFATAVPSNRYDPKVIRRVVELEGLSDFDLDDNDESSTIPDIDEYGIDDDGLPNSGLPLGTSIYNGGNQWDRRKSSGSLRFVTLSLNPFCKQILALMATVSLIVFSVAMMGVFLTREIIRDEPLVDELETSSGSIDNAVATKKIYATNLQSTAFHSEEELFRLAEEVLKACSENMLNKDITSCQRLCKNEMCCFENEDEYNCSWDREKMCLAHAGCEALVDNVYTASSNQPFVSFPGSKGSYFTEHDLIRTTERVNEACSERQLNLDASGCREICRSEMCCFDNNEKYSCAKGREKSCRAHAACYALLKNDRYR